TGQLLSTLDRLPQGQFSDQIAALPGRFATVLENAAEMCEPEAQFIQVPRRTLKTDGEIDSWAEEVKQQLKTALKKGPVVIR
ncbi:MAG: hypothetical protein COZ12_08575, partial [Deltaproteobacteria bacterium CG_4_10_14_3_um_filter_60_8]